MPCAGTAARPSLPLALRSMRRPNGPIAAPTPSAGANWRFVPSTAPHRRRRHPQPTASALDRAAQGAAPARRTRCHAARTHGLLSAPGAQPQHCNRLGRGPLGAAVALNVCFGGLRARAAPTPRAAALEAGARLRSQRPVTLAPLAPGAIPEAARPAGCAPQQPAPSPPSPRTRHPASSTAAAAPAASSPSVRPPPMHTCPKCSHVARVSVLRPTPLAPPSTGQ